MNADERALQAMKKLSGDMSDLLRRAVDRIVELEKELATIRNQVEAEETRANAAEAALAETKRERDELSDYAFEATKAITNLTVGGSEFFGKKLCDGRYSADLPYCVAHIQGRVQRQHEAILRESQKRHAAEAQRDEALKALEPFADIADLIDSEMEGMSETDELALHFHDYLMASWPVSIFSAARRAL